MSLFAGIDLGGTHTRFCLYQNGQFLASEKYKTETVMSGKRPIDSLTDWMGVPIDGTPCSSGNGRHRSSRDVG